MGTANRIKPAKLAIKLKTIRLALGLTMDKMTEELAHPDIKLYRGTIHNYENGDREPPLPILLNYARLANVYVDVLIDDTLELPKKLPAKTMRIGVLEK